MNITESDRLLRHFRQVGYARSADILPGVVVDKLRDFVATAIAREEPPFRTNAQGRVVRIDRVLDRDTMFIETLKHEAFRGLIESILGPNVVVLKTRHNHATLNRAGDIPFRFHRDILQWSRPIITAIVYLEEATVERGCTHVIPGSHLLPFAGMPPDGGGGNWLDDHEEYRGFKTQGLPVPMSRGQLLLLDSLAFHTVGSNSSSESRASLTFALRSVDELERQAPHLELLFGEWVYKGNDLDYNRPAPAFNTSQAVETTSRVQ